jgi:hypothetical protein
MEGAALGLASYRSQLASAILTDIELRRVTSEQLLMKARRLANAAGDSDVEEWLGYELGGYPAELPPQMAPFVDRVGRWYPNEKGKFYREGFLRILDVIPAVDEAWRHNMSVKELMKRRSKLPGNRPKPDPTNWEDTLQRSVLQLIHLQEITVRVRVEIHRYASTTFHRFRFSELANAIFDRHKETVDALLRARAPEVLDKIPAIYDRLANGEMEAISHALSSCRRMIDEFADVVFPPSDKTVLGEDGIQHRLTKQETCNRLQQFSKEHGKSERRVERLNKTLRLVYGRVSAGVHSDVTPQEAQALFLLTYLTLGELAELGGSKG